MPAIRKADNIVGMYDEVSKTFFENSSDSGEFAAEVVGSTRVKRNGKIANFNYQYDFNPVLLWQYSNSPNLSHIIENEQYFTDVAITDFCREFDSKIFNLRTCDANGLDLWGTLLGVQRPMLTDGQATDEQYRLLLLSRFSVLIWDGSCAGLTKIIKTLFPNVLFKITDNLDMTVDIDFSEGLSSDEEAILSMGYSDEITGEFVYTFLPRPAGVAYNISFATTWETTLGFEGMTETTNMGGAYDCDPDDHTGETGTENPDGGVFYK